MSISGVSASTIAKWLLLRGLEPPRRVIDGFVMEKMFVLQGICLQETGEALFDEDFHMDLTESYRGSISIEGIGHGWDVLLDKERSIMGMGADECHALWDRELAEIGDEVIERMEKVLCEIDEMGSMALQELLRHGGGAFHLARRAQMCIIPKQLIAADDFEVVRRALHDKADVPIR